MSIEDLMNVEVIGLSKPERSEAPANLNGDERVGQRLCMDVEVVAELWNASGNRRGENDGDLSWKFRSAIPRTRLVEGQTTF